MAWSMCPMLLCLTRLLQSDTSTHTMAGELNILQLHSHPQFVLDQLLLDQLLLILHLIESFVPFIAFLHQDLLLPGKSLV